MNLAIVYDSSTGNTKAAAEQMAETVRSAGHDCTVASIQQADPAEVTAADAICIGSWTKGLYIILQGPTPATLDFIGKLGRLDGKPAAVFTTYVLSGKKALAKLTAAMSAKGSNVTGQFASKGSHAAPDFGTWVEGLNAS